MNTKMTIRGAAMAAVLAFAPSVMAKSLHVLLYVGSRPQGTTFQTCNSNGLWAQASGWDSGGSLRCLVRQFSNNLWATTSQCPADATQLNTFVRTTGNSFCTSGMAAWGGGPTCSVNSMFLKPNGGACVNVGTVTTFSHSAN